MVLTRVGISKLKRVNICIHFRVSYYCPCVLSKINICYPPPNNQKRRIRKDNGNEVH